MIDDQQRPKVPNAFFLPLYICRRCGPTKVWKPNVKFTLMRCAQCGGKLLGVKLPPKRDGDSFQLRK